MIIQAIKTCPTMVSALAFSSIIALTVKILVLNHFPEAFPGAHDIGVVVEAILASIFAAYIFFIISIQIPNIQHKRHINATIVADLALGAIGNITGFVQFCEAHVTPSGQKVKILSPDEVSEQKISELFSAIDPSSISAMGDIRNNRPRFTMIQAMARHNEFCMQYIEKIWRFINHLEPELVAKLYSVENSVHAIRMQDFRKHYFEVGLQNEDLTVYADEFYKHFMKALEVKSYFERLKSSYL